MRRMLALIITLILSTFLLMPVLAQGQGKGPQGGIRRNVNALHNRYIIVLDDSVAGPEVAGVANKLAVAHGSRPEFIYTRAIKGFDEL